MKITIISHSYIVKENQKNIYEIAKHTPVQTVIPDHINDVIFKKIYIDINQKNAFSLIFKRISLKGSQYFLRTLDMGMKKFRPDIIHVEYDPWSTIFWQCYLYKKLYVPKAIIICTVKNNTYKQYQSLRGYLKHAIAKFFIRKVHFFIAVNTGVEKIYQSIFNIPPEKISILQHLGIDTKIFYPKKKQPSNNLVIGYCGRFDEDKGILDLIEAVRNCQKDITISLRLLGNGTLKEKISAKKYKWLQILEPIPHHKVAEFMNSIDIFVLPSRITKEHEEHDAHALIEALACGIPSIGSSSGVIPEILQPNIGLTYSSGNVMELKEKILELAQNQKLRTKFSKNAVKIVEQLFSVTTIAQKKIEIYQRVTNGI